jgi:bacillithiol biosynthesis deacetylase BshB1
LKLDVLAIAAHRDDVELTIGGTVTKLADLGYRVGILDLTQGEMGTRGTAQQRKKEAECAAKIMGVVKRENLGLPDSKVENTYENKLKIVKTLRNYKPHLVILPYWEQRHPDHANASRLGYEACYLAGLAKLNVPGDRHRPFKIIYTSSFTQVKHTFIVDITEQFQRKIQAVKCYKSQFGEAGTPPGPFPLSRSVYDFLETTAAHFGHLIRKKYGEAFIAREITEVEDPMKLLVQSI